MTPAGRAWARAGALALAVLVCDQAAKAIAVAQIELGEQVDVLGPLGLTLTHNRGIAFGMAGGAGLPLVLLGVAVLLAVLFAFSRNAERPGMWVATGLLVGGAVGNLVDRIRLGHVIDFVDLPRWPAFNLADVSITCGVIVLAGVFLLDRPRAEPSGA